MDSGMTSTFRPGVKFNRNMNFGDIYATAVLPITYLDCYSGADTAVGLELGIGWDSSFGLGLWITEVLAINEANGRDTGHDRLDLGASYETGPFYAEAEANIYNYFDKNGMTLMAKFQYTIFKGFSAWLKCEFERVGADSGDIFLNPSLGVKYSF
jgi:hypothetical protein